MENEEKDLKNDMFEKLSRIIDKKNIYINEPMKKHTTFRVGGPADYFVLPTEVSQIINCIQLCKEEQIPYFILGNGSNLLVSDKGYRGVVIQIYKNMNHIQIDGHKIKAQAGALLSQIAKKALDAGLSGFEFASGIPGTLGGAAVMNAGAYGGEMKDILTSVTVLDENGQILHLEAKDLQLGYRTSIIKEKGYVVLEVELELQMGDPTQIQKRMEELKGQRVTKQPLEFPSAGSTFKRPVGYFAGKLIQDAGLRGFQIGDAQVSEKHCGFVINRGNATASEIAELIREVQRRVWENSGVHLETEVKFLGDF